MKRNIVEKGSLQASTWRRWYERLFGPPYLSSSIKSWAIVPWVCSGAQPALILDAGCGHGDLAWRLARLFPTTQVIAVDLDWVVLAECQAHLARRLPNLHFVCADLRRPIFPSVFDLALSVDVLEHVVEDGEMLDSLFQSLRPGGILIVHVPKRHQDQHRVFGGWAPWSGHGHVRDEYTLEEIIARLAAAGFVVQETGHTFGRLAAPFWEIGAVLRARHPVALWLLFPILKFLCYFDHLLPGDEGNGLLLRAGRPTGSLESDR